MMIPIRITMFLVAILFMGCTVNNPESAGLLVSGSWLKEELNEPDIILLHLGTEEGYYSLHIPGARFMDPYNFMVDIDGLRNELPPVDTIVDLLRSVGVNTDSRIVLCSESDRLITRTARVFMTLDYAGLGDRTCVLNGGLQGWSEAGFRTVTGDRGLLPVTEGDVKAGDVHEVIIRARELNRQRWNPEYVIIDVRSAEEYYGEVDSTGENASGGHIEGAYFMPYSNLLTESDPYFFLEDEAMLKEFEKVGMDANKTAVYYCGSGVRASASYLVARHLAYPALLYDGSIEEWENLELSMTAPVIQASEK